MIYSYGYRSWPLHILAGIGRCTSLHHRRRWSHSHKENWRTRSYLRWKQINQEFNLNELSDCWNNNNNNINKENKIWSKCSALKRCSCCLRRKNNLGLWIVWVSLFEQQKMFWQSVEVGSTPRLMLQKKTYCPKEWKFWADEASWAHLNAVRCNVYVHK